MPGYTNIDISEHEDGSEIVINCNDCGAFVINGTKKQIKHHLSCEPISSNPKLFNVDESL